jgi:ribose transport system substrate-binding protein
MSITTPPPRQRVTRTLAALGTTAAIAAVLSACGSSDTSAGTSGATGATAGSDGGKAANVAFLTFSNDGLYLPKEVEGVTDVIGRSGGTVKIFDAKLDQQKQLNQCQDAISSGRYNVIVLQPVDPAGAAVCAREAAAADIPVFAFEFPVGTDPNTLEPQLDGVDGSVVGTIQSQAEKTFQAFEAGCKGDSDCKVALEVASRADPLGSAQIDLLKSKGPAAGIQLVAITEGAYDIAQTAQKLPDVLQANPDLDVFLTEADTNAIAAIPIIKDAGMSDQIKIMGLGGSTSMIDAIKSGTAYGTVAYWPRTAGTVVGQMIQDTLDGKTVAEPAVDLQAVAPGQPVIVTQENVDTFTPEWGQQ